MIQFNDIRATIAGTPAHTARAGVAALGGRDVRHHAGGILRFPTENVRANRNLNFATPNALVLMRDAIANMPIVLNYAPINVPIRWTVIRSADDAAALGAGVPAIAAVAGQPASNETLNTDQVGSFLVSAYVDVNNLGRYVASDPRTFLPLIFVNAAVVRNDTAAHAANLSLNRIAPGGVWAGNVVRTRTNASERFDIDRPDGEGDLLLAARVRPTCRWGRPQRSARARPRLRRLDQQRDGCRGCRGELHGRPRDQLRLRKDQPRHGGDWPAQYVPKPPDPAARCTWRLRFSTPGRGGAGTGGETATLATSRIRAPPMSPSGKR